MSDYTLAQLNIGVIRGPMDSPVMAQFAASLEGINALADSSPGFIWRLQTEAGDATALRPFDDPGMLVNMSVWRDLDCLRQFVYQSAHAPLMRRRREWFERMTQSYMVLWWIPRGHVPSVEEAMARLTMLRERGPSAEAFTFRDAFAPPDAQDAGLHAGVPEACPAG
jgi:uncharacterized protein DUF3291